MENSNIKNITGKKYGRLSVIKFYDTHNRRSYWECKCDCGKIGIFLGKTLLSGGTKSCGCLQKEKIHASNFNDISGKKFGYLTVKRYCGYDGEVSKWECKCDCGENTIVRAYKLTSGHTKSCGCLHKESCKKRAIIRNKQMVGDKHPRWRYDLSKEDRLLGIRIHGKMVRSYIPKLYRWRKNVYDRDKYTCKKCGNNKSGNNKSGNLVAHHIYSWAYYPKLRFVTNNGITLCTECHKKFHKEYGVIKNTKKQWSKFIKK